VGKLAELLAQPTAQEVEVQTSFDDQGNFTQSKVIDAQPATPEAVLLEFGHDPAKFCIDGPVSIAHRELTDGRVVSTYRYKLRERPSAVDIDDLVSQARKAKKHRETANGGPFWFVFQASDLQIGKVSRDGSTEEIISRYLDSIERAVEEFNFLKCKGIEGIQISMPGDLCEGNVSQGGKNVWLTQETITEQTRILRRLMLQTVEAFAPLTNRIYLDVISGNHDQAQRQWNTFPGDGWATECAIAVDDALKMNPAAFGHVEVRVPNQWSGHMTVPVGDTNVTIVHGHQFGRQANAMKWWQEQAFGNHPPAGAHLMQNGHFHEVAVERAGDRTRVQSPTLDCGSDWYREKRGVGNTRGALAYLLRAGDVSRLSLV
jgi:hypothetical protein